MCCRLFLHRGEDELLPEEEGGNAPDSIVVDRAAVAEQTASTAAILAMHPLHSQSTGSMPAVWGAYH